jgi:hypothetical protein
MTTAREFALTVITRAGALDGRDPMRRCLRKHAKAVIERIDDTARARAKGLRCEGEDLTVDDVRARLVSECENAATWHMGPEGRAQLESILA